MLKKFISHAEAKGLFTRLPNDENLIIHFMCMQLIEKAILIKIITSGF